MCGSGTTPRVACEMGRKYIGIDISHEYCAIAKERVQRIIDTPTLFILEEPREEYIAEDE
jgi:DNA modification methylase